MSVEPFSRTLLSCDGRGVAGFVFTIGDGFVCSDGGCTVGSFGLVTGEVSFPFVVTG